MIRKGNLLALVLDVKAAGDIGTLATTLPTLVRDYALFHGFIALVSLALAIRCFRGAAFAQTSREPIKRFRLLPVLRRPSLGLNPMLWKEFHCEGRGRRPWLTLVWGLAFLAATFVPAALIIWVVAHSGIGALMLAGPDSSRLISSWVRSANAGVGCLTALAVAIRASASIAGERDKQTLEILLTTPLTSGAILHAKWIGSIYSVRFGLLWLGLVWLVGLVTGALSFVALPFVIAAWFSYAALAAMIGLWFSVVSRSSLRAVVFTILAMVFLSGGSGLIGLCCATPIGAAMLTPPFVMWILAFSPEDFYQASSQDHELRTLCTVAVAVWAAAPFYLFGFTKARFASLTSRGALLEKPVPRRPLPAIPMTPWFVPLGTLAQAQSDDDTLRARQGGDESSPG